MYCEIKLYIYTDSCQSTSTNVNSIIRNKCLLFANKCKQGKFPNVNIYRYICILLGLRIFIHYSFTFMKDRIIKIMETENLSSTMLADKLGVSRAVISHILNGRNNPSLDVVTRILQELPYIDSDWLIMGSGNMFKEGADVDLIKKSESLFSQNVLNEPKDALKNIEEQEKTVERLPLDSKVANREASIVEKTVVKKINQIIIYYDDNTFEIFYKR